MHKNKTRVHINAFALETILSWNLSVREMDLNVEMDLNGLARWYKRLQRQQSTRKGTGQLYVAALCSFEFGHS